MDKLVELIRHYCQPSQSLYKMSSYALKGLFELLTGEYVSNQDFKAAMMAAGYEPTPESKGRANHLYRLRVTDSPDVPQMYRGRGYQTTKEQRQQNPERRLRNGRV